MEKSNEVGFWFTVLSSLWEMRQNGDAWLSRRIKAKAPLAGARGSDGHKKTPGSFEIRGLEYGAWQ